MQELDLLNKTKTWEAKLWFKEYNCTSNVGY